MTDTYRTDTLKRVVGILIVALAIAGCSHGFFEMLQGYKPTGGFGIDSVGPELGLWGEDPALTILHNFLLTGLISFSLGLVAIYWGLFRIDSRHGALILLAIFVGQTAFGGGVGYIPFYLILCAWAFRIGKPLSGLARLPAGLRRMLAPLALPWALFSALLWLLALFESIAGLSAPALGDQNTLYLVWSALLVVLITMNIALLGAAARDIDNR